MSLLESQDRINCLSLLTSMDDHVQAVGRPLPPDTPHVSYSSGFLAHIPSNLSSLGHQRVTTNMEGLCGLRRGGGMGSQ